MVGCGECGGFEFIVGGTLGQVEGMGNRESAWASWRLSLLEGRRFWRASGLPRCDGFRVIAGFLGGENCINNEKLLIEGLFCYIFRIYRVFANEKMGEIRK